MLTKKLKEFGLTSDILNIMGLASILGSIAVWFSAKKETKGHGERFGIFVGLWAPTFFILGGSLSNAEQDELLHKAAGE